MTHAASPTDAPAQDWMRFATPRLLGRDYAERAQEARQKPRLLYPVGCLHPIIQAPPDLDIAEAMDIHSFGIRFLTAADDPRGHARVAFTLFRPVWHDGSPAAGTPPAPENATDFEEAPDDVEEDDHAAAPSETDPLWVRERVDLDRLEVNFPASTEWVESAECCRAIREALDAVARKHREDPAGVRLDAPSPWWDIRVWTRRSQTPQGWLCEILLSNEVVIPFEDRNARHEQAAFDCELELQTDAPILRMPATGFTHWDRRVEANLDALGINCGVDTSDIETGRLRIEVIPTLVRPHRAHRRTMPVSARPYPSFEALATPATAVAPLEDVERDLRAYVAQLERAHPEADAAEWRAERDGYASGLARLRTDAQALRAFCLVNQAFRDANRSRGIDRWRPFQIVGLVMEARHLGESAKDAPVSVIQMSTGGGKTELYLAVSLLWAFYARLRGEVAGTVAWATFPLRLLSLQQAERVLRVLSAANELLAHEANIPASSRRVPFSVGYYAGGQNSANDLWSGSTLPELLGKDSELFSTYVEASREAPFPPTGALPAALSPPMETLKKNRKVVHCPVCMRNGQKSVVRTSFDQRAARFRHVCSACAYELPLYVSDAEVIRHQPTIVVGTLDKMARLSTHEEDLLVYGGARAECPVHGYCARAGVACRVDGCRQRTQALPAPLRGPRVIIQDELHLVKESFGALAAPYERLRNDVLAANNTGVPPRIICSTATITGYERHVQELYGRRNVERLPAPGPTPGESFHQIELDTDHRVFHGLLPTKVSGQRLVQRLTDIHLRWIAAKQTQGQPFSQYRDFAALLVYCLTKANLQKHKATLLDTLNLRSLRPLGIEPVEGDRVLELSGDTDADEVSSALERLENPTPDRYVRVLYATNMISHGVDLESLNVMLVDGVPNSVAEHIQATSRVGRGGETGLVLCVYNRMSRRDLSLFPYHKLHHEVLEARVPPTNMDAGSEAAWRVAARGYVLHWIHRQRLAANKPEPTKAEAAQLVVQHHDELLKALEEFTEGRFEPAQLRDVLIEARLALESEDTFRQPFRALRLLTSLRDIPEGVPIYPIEG